MPISKASCNSSNGRRAEDAADVAALAGIPIHHSGKEGHDDDFEIEKE
jgi:hypothetical protein